MLWPPDNPCLLGGGQLQSGARIECRLAKVKKGDIIYDLGSGEGTALIIAAKEYGATGIGIEIDPFQKCLSKINVKLFWSFAKVETRRDNFWNQDISEAAVIFMYLIPKTLIKLRPKFLKELKPGTRVVTFVYQMDLPLVAKDEKAELYCYEIPKKSKIQD